MECWDYWKQTGPKWGTWLLQEFCCYRTNSFIESGLPTLDSFRPFTQFTKWMCVYKRIVLFTWSIEVFGTAEKWHCDIPWMVNACCPLKTRAKGYAFSLWLTTANQNFLSSCLFTTFIDPLVLFSCAFMCLPTMVRHRVVRSKRNKRQPLPVMITLDIRLLYISWLTYIIPDVQTGVAVETSSNTRECIKRVNFIIFIHQTILKQSMKVRFA